MADWRDLAACRGLDPDLFYAEKEVGEGGDYTPAKRICGSCVVRVECLEWALSEPELWGVWGGLTLKERRRYRKARERRAS